MVQSINGSKIIITFGPNFDNFVTCEQSFKVNSNKNAMLLCSILNWGILPYKSSKQECDRSSLWEPYCIVKVTCFPGSLIHSSWASDVLTSRQINLQIDRSLSETSGYKFYLISHKGTSNQTYRETSLLRAACGHTAFGMNFRCNQTQKQYRSWCVSTTRLRFLFRFWFKWLI